jgi:hypothetical protein
MKIKVLMDKSLQILNLGASKDKILEIDQKMIEEHVKY